MTGIPSMESGDNDLGSEYTDTSSPTAASNVAKNFESSLRSGNPVNSWLGEKVLRKSTRPLSLSEGEKM